MKPRSPERLDYWWQHGALHSFTSVVETAKHLPLVLVKVHPHISHILTCRPSSSAIPSRVVSGGALAGVAVLQASCASLKSRAGEWIFCWMEPRTACSHLGSPRGVVGTEG